MAEPEHFDVLILGSGQGGKVLAWQMARSGRRTAVVERRWIGGSCPNIACMPSKNDDVERPGGASGAPCRAVRHGRRVPSRPTWRRCASASATWSNREIELHLQNYRASGAELIMGSGRFVAPKTVEVHLNDGGTRVLAGEQVFLNLGTHAAVPDIPGLEAARPLTHVEALELDYLPSHLIVLGGGYVGLELAQAYRRFGSRVTVIEAGPRIMSREDPDVARGGAADPRRRGHPVSARGGGHSRARPLRRAGRRSPCARPPASGRSRAATSWLPPGACRIPPASGWSRPGSSWTSAATSASTSGWRQVRPMSGRSANAPVARNSRTPRSTISGSFATTSPAEAAARDDRLVPYCMFTDPPLAHVGLSESEARAQGIAVRVARLPMRNVLRTEATDETQGFMKVLVGERRPHPRLYDDRLRSRRGHGRGADRDAGGLPYQRLRDAVIAHLTMAEGLGPLLSTVPPDAFPQPDPLG